MIKLCRDCKYYKKYWGYEGYNGIYDECTCPSIQQEVNLVDGSKRFVFCTFERSYVKSCGPDAKYWEPKPEKPETKENFWSRIFNFR